MNQSVVSYIGRNGAPHISALKNMFYNNLYKDRNIKCELAAIVTQDILRQLVKKKIISKISLTVAVPNDEILSNVMGIDAKSFDLLQNVKSRTATYNITSPRNKNIFESSDKLSELISVIKSKFGSRITALSAKAKDDKEKSQVYDLLQYNFTKTVDLETIDGDVLNIESFYNALTSTYESNKDELVRYSKV